MQDLHVLSGITLNGSPLGFAEMPEVCFDPDPYCAACGRCTDHVGEHDDLVDAGLVVYGPGPGEVNLAAGVPSRFFVTLWHSIRQAYNPDWWRA